MTPATALYLSKQHSRLHRSACRLLQSLLVILLLLWRCDAATTATIGGIYETGSSALTILSYYTTGITIPASAASNNQVSYSVTFSTTTNTWAWSIYSIFSASGNIVAVFGPANTFMMTDIYKYKNNAQALVAFGILSQTVNINTQFHIFNAYRPNMYWVIPQEGIQSLALFYHLSQMSRFAVKQLVFTSGAFGIGKTATLLFALQMPKFGVTSIASTATTPNTAQKPGVIYNLGQYDNPDNSVNADTKQWFTTVVSDSNVRAANATMANTFQMQPLVQQFYPGQSSTTLPMANFLATSPVPGVDDTTYDVTQQFRTSNPSMSGVNFYSNFQYASWVAGTALMQALYTYSSSSYTNPVNFYNTFLAAQSSFLVEDLFIGSYGPTCNAVAEDVGGICSCNQAGMNIFFTTLGKTSTRAFDAVAIPNAWFQYASGKCASVIPPGDLAVPPTPYTDLVNLYVPQRLVGLSTTDNTMIEDMCTVLNDVVSLLSNRALYAHLASNLYFSTCVSTTTTSASTALSTHMSTWVTTALMGVIPDTVVASSTMSSTFVLDFMPQTTQPRISKTNLVYLFPTLDQELYVLASYVHGAVTTASVVCGVVSTSTSSSAVKSLLTKTLTTFTLPYEAANIVTVTGTGALLGTSIPDGCTHTFAIGLGSTDAAGLVTYLQGHASATVFVSFDDVTKYYDSVQTAFGGLPSSVADRLVFSTNLPSWTATPSNPTAAATAAPLSTVTQFLQSVAPSLQTPAVLRAFIVATVYDHLSARNGPDPDVQQLLYEAVTVSVDGTLFGPFSEGCSAIDASSGTCVGNYGARDIAVWSYTNVVTPGASLVAQPSTPSMMYLSSAVSGAVGGETLVKAVDATTCIEVHESSAADVKATSSSSSHHSVSASKHESVSHKGSVAAPTDDRASSSRRGSSGSGSLLDTLMIVLAVALGVAVLVVVALLLLKHGVVSCCVRCVHDCCDCSAGGGYGSMTVLVDGGKRLEACACAQQQTMDVSRALVTAGGLTTVVFVDVCHWLLLWVREPVVMSRVVKQYERRVRDAVLEHGCVEVRGVGGMFVLWCPCASTGLQLCLAIERAAAAASLAYVDALNAVYALVAPPVSGETARVCGLRVRVCMHVEDVRDAVGSVSAWLLPAAEVAACAATACPAGCSLVLTGAAHDALPEDARACVVWEPLGTRVLKMRSGSRGMELFVGRAGVSGGAADGVEHGMSGNVVTECCTTDALVVLETCSEALRPSREACLKRLAVLYGAEVTGCRAVPLAAMCEWLCAVPLSGSEAGLNHECSDALLTAVADRVGALVEYRHGISRCGSHVVAVKSELRGNEHVVIGLKMGVRDGGRVRTSSRDRRARSHRLLRHFSYGVEECDV